MLEIGDHLGDVDVQLEKVLLAVLGSLIPVLAACHRVHDVLSEKQE